VEAGAVEEGEEDGAALGRSEDALKKKAT